MEIKKHHSLAYYLGLIVGYMFVTIIALGTIGILGALLYKLILWIVTWF